MSVSVSKAGPFFASGPITFSELRRTFRAQSQKTSTGGSESFAFDVAPISMSELKRDTNPQSPNPIVPDATENSAIGSVSDVALSQFRNSIKFYYISQTGTDIYFDIDALGWNSNLDKTITKTIFIDGDIGSDNALSPAASFEQSPAYNLLFDITGTIKGGPGIGGGKTGNVSISGQNGGTALSIISTGGENLTVLVRSSARIYGGGGGGEKERQEIRVLLDYAKTMRLFGNVIVALIAQLDGYQQVGVTLELDVVDEELVIGGEVVGSLQMVGGDMMTVLMNIR